MFTGIIEETGMVESVHGTAQGIQLVVRVKKCARGLRRGDSLAVNGCCLTVVEIKARQRRKLVRVDLLRETWDRTNLKAVKPGSLVNLERALRNDSRLGGHFVTGHIDGVGRIKRWERRGADWLLEVAAPPDVMRYVVFKGAIAIDGISLTVAGIRQDRCRVWIIPHTHQVTALRERQVGDTVNLEADLLGKYVEKFIRLPRQRRTH